MDSELIELHLYHGTTKENAQLIEQNGFNKSTKNNEWLGYGVYFFHKKKDADRWAIKECKKSHNLLQTPVAVCVKVRCEKNEFLDLDIFNNFVKMSREMDAELEEMDKSPGGRPKFKGTVEEQKKQFRCFCCNYYARIKNIKIMCYSFPKMYTNSIGFDNVNRQRQYCVFECSCIGEEKQIKEVSEYAV